MRKIIAALLLIALLPVMTIANAAAADSALSDVPLNSWAYQYVTELQQAGIVTGYPDGYFKGDRPLTRYEMAAVVARAEETLKARLAAPSTAQTVTPEMVAALRKLIDTYGVEIDSLKKQVAQNTTDIAAVKTQTAAIQSQTADLTTKVNRNQLHVAAFTRAGTYNENVSAYTAAGVPLPAGVAMVGQNAGTAANAYISGNSNHGAGKQILREFLESDLDSHTLLSTRMTQQFLFDNTAMGGNSTSTLNPAGLGTYPNNATFKLDWAYVQYKENSGFFGRAGRIIDVSSPVFALLYAENFNGAAFGYQKKNIDAVFGYGFERASNSNSSSTTGGGTVCPTTASPCQSAQSFYGHAWYTTGKFEVGLSYEAQHNYYSGMSLYNPVARVYQSAADPYVGGGLQVQWNPSPMFTANLETIHRFGTDPFQGKPWIGPNGAWLEGIYGKRTLYGNYLQAGFLDIGMNAGSPTLGSTSPIVYQSFYVTNTNGYKNLYAVYNHVFAPGATIGLGYQAFSTNGAIPIAGYTLPGAAAVTPCLGCYIARDDIQTIFLQLSLKY